MQNKNLKIIAMVPGRLGSTRLPQKNLALLEGKPLIYYPIKAAKESGLFSRVVLNAENEIFGEIAKRYGIEFYKRPLELASSSAKSDFVVYDFVKNNPCDIIAWINPIAPFQTSGDVKNVINYFIKEKLDSLITVKDEQVHAMYKGNPVNFSMEGVFAQTQDLVPVQLQIYSVMMWRTETFMDKFEKDGCAVLCGKVGYYPLSKLSSLIIKRKEDLMMAEALMKTFKNEYEVNYDDVLKKEVI